MTDRKGLGMTGSEMNKLTVATMQVEALRKQLADAQATVEALQRERDEWRSNAVAQEVRANDLERDCKDLLSDIDGERAKVGDLLKKIAYWEKRHSTYRELAEENMNLKSDELSAHQGLVRALQRERDKLREATKVICGHCCEPMAIPSKAILQSQLSALQGLVETIKCELFDRYDGAPDSPTRWMGPLIRDIEIAQALPATPTERGEGHSGDDTDMVQNEGGDGE